jgi:hypothetical protein
VERLYGVALDPGMTKVELVGEAGRLASSDPQEATPIAGLDGAGAKDEEPALPLDLLR